MSGEDTCHGVELFFFSLKFNLGFRDEILASVRQLG